MTLCFALLATLSACSHMPPLAPKRLALQGTVVTPQEVLPNAWVVIANGRIQSITTAPPKAADLLRLKTDAIILPGLVDVHNHVAWNALPRWTPPRQYAHRYEWRYDPAYADGLGTAGREIMQDHYCAMHAYAELRALIGGTTSILATKPNDCIAGLVRNLDVASDFYDETEAATRSVTNELELRSHDPLKAAEIDGYILPRLSAARADLERQRLGAWFVHLAEGRRADAASRDEFDILRSDGLLTERTTVIHGTALGPSEFAAMAAAGTGLAWSPRSNMVLYGETTDVRAARAAGVEIALSPDWSLTGSVNLLEEIGYAAAYDDRELGDSFSDADWLAMSSSIPARLAGADDRIGAIQAGHFADLLVLHGDRQQPYRALRDAQPRDVALVVVGGEALYGDAAWMQRLNAPRASDELDVDGRAKRVRLPEAIGNLASLRRELEAAYAAHKLDLPPLGALTPDP